VLDLKPRKLPRQDRSRATVDAILEACARLLAEGGLAGLSTNRIARRAGVAIGSLYEFFPSRESILLSLTQQRLARLEGELRAIVERALARGGRGGAEQVIRGVVEAVSADRVLYRVLLFEAPFLRRRPEIERALASLFEIGRLGAERARRQTTLRDPDTASWLIGRMLAHVVLEIATLDAGTRRREELIRELARLTTRMIQGRDPRGGGRAEGAGR
jgi:AcrR family transcriptional regulator